MNGMKLFWGVVALMLGTVLLATNMGYLGSSIWISILALWPLVLVVFGLRLIIQDNKFFALSLLVVLVLATGFVVYDYTQVTKSESDNQSFMGFRRDTSTVSENFSDTYDVTGIKNLNLSLSTGAARVNVKPLPADAAAGTLYRVATRDMGELTINKTVSGDRANITISESNTGLHLGRGMMTTREIDLYLPAPLVLQLNIDSGASKLSLDFKTLQTESVELNVGASASDIFLSDKPASQSLILQAGASNITFHIPATLGVKAVFDGGLNRVNTELAPEITKLDNTYTTKTTTAKLSQISITGSAGVSGVKFIAE